MKKLSRKSFLKKAGITSLASASILSSCVKNEEDTSAPNVISNKKYKWKMVTTWPPNFPVLGEGCNLFAKWVEEMTGGQLQIQVYGAGELIPALEVFEAVNGGAAELGSGVSYYWAGKMPAAQFFASIPFGMSGQQMNAWMYSGGGLELYRKSYERFNLYPFPAGNTGVQMAGWFNKEINSKEDFKGLKIRMPGLGGKVIQKLGGTAVLSAGGEIYTNLERGVIDATEWIGPYHDYIMGFHKIAKYYYYPGWHEPGSQLELISNKRSFDQLPVHLQQILEAAAYRLNLWTLSSFEALNNTYLEKIIAESNIELRKLPTDVLTALKQASNEVIDELISKDEESRNVYAAYSRFQKSISNWSKLSEKSYYMDLQ